MLAGAPKIRNFENRGDPPGIGGQKVPKNGPTVAGATVVVRPQGGPTEGVPQRLGEKSVCVGTDGGKRSKRGQKKAEWQRVARCAGKTWARSQPGRKHARMKSRMRAVSPGGARGRRSPLRPASTDPTQSRFSSMGRALTVSGVCPLAWTWLLTMVTPAQPKANSWSMRSFRRRCSAAAAAPSDPRKRWLRQSQRCHWPRMRDLRTVVSHRMADLRLPD